MDRLRIGWISHPQQVSFTFPPEVLQNTKWWINAWTHYWHYDELPMKIHNREIDEGGAPQWSDEFRRWISVEGHHIPGSGDRLRTTRAFRKLRKKNAREYEVLYRTVVLRYDLEDTAEWLTARAIRNDKPERYTKSDAMILLVSATDKVLRWW